MSLTEKQLLDDVRRRLFAPARSASPRAIGLELELIPVHRATRQRALVAERGSGTSKILSNLALQLGWGEQPADGDAPSWNLADGSRISFEPGGQLEFSTAPYPGASKVIDVATELVGRVRDAMSESGIELLAVGVDPYNSVGSVPLQRNAERYRGMTRFFESIGPSGVQMMRQTAALQMNVERGPNPVERWRLLNALAPIIVAVFARSREYAGSRTGHQSYRAHLWRTLDATRTGIISNGDDPVSEYHEFALNALAMRSGRETGSYLTFREWMKQPEIDTDEWSFHLSTLFPEVRAKEYFELRSADTIDIDFLAAPVVFVTGIVYDERSAKEAGTILAPPDTGLLERSGRSGLDDPEIRELAGSMTELALSGAARLGEDYLAPNHIRIAREFFSRVLEQ